MTQDPQLHFPSEGNRTQDFYDLKKIHRPQKGMNLQTSNPVASIITTGTRGQRNNRNEGSIAIIKKLRLQFFYFYF